MRTADIVEFVYYKSERGLYLARGREHSRTRQTLDAEWYRFNGKHGVATHNEAWLLIGGEDDLATVEHKKRGAKVNFRWELLRPDEPVVERAGLPAVLSQEESEERYDDDEYKWTIANEKYKDFSHLYERRNDRKEDYWEEEESTLTCLGTIESDWVDNPVTDKYEVYRTTYKSEGTREITLSKDASYSELEQMLVPELLIHNRPCGVSSSETYKIIRHWVLRNIDPEQASVTSDYDFCFTVKKRIPVKPFTHQREVLTPTGRSRRRPKFTTITTKEQLQEVFEMTHAGVKYERYTVIKGFSGENLRDLAETIRTYLDELMAYINLPISECSECGGTGHILDGVFAKNNRNQD